MYVILIRGEGDGVGAYAAIEEFKNMPTKAQIEKALSEWAWECEEDGPYMLVKEVKGRLLADNYGVE
jgi:hypothetical protein